MMTIKVYRLGADAVVFNPTEYRLLSIDSECAVFAVL